MSGRPRIIFMGTPDFAVPSLRALAGDSRFEIAAVITQPDKPTGRKQVLTPPPVKQAAEELGLPVLQPVRVRLPEALEQIRVLRPDVTITAAYGQILPQSLLDIPGKGNLNVHASLLPRWRGAAPIHRAIMAGDKETGVSIMEMVQALDAGPVVGVTKVNIAPDDNVGSLHDKLASAGADLLLQLLPGYLDGSIAPTNQPDEGVTYAERIRSADERLDFGLSARQVYNHIRGLSPWPGASTVWNSANMKVWAALPAGGARTTGSPGQVTVLPGEGLCVRCQDGWLRLITVQPAGKKRMDAEQWFRGVQADHTEFEGITKQP